MRTIFVLDEPTVCACMWSGGESHSVDSKQSPGSKDGLTMSADDFTIARESQRVLVCVVALIPWITRVLVAPDRSLCATPPSFVGFFVLESYKNCLNKKCVATRLPGRWWCQSEARWTSAHSTFKLWTTQMSLHQSDKEKMKNNERKHFKDKTLFFNLVRVNMRRKQKSWKLFKLNKTTHVLFKVDVLCELILVKQTEEDEDDEGRLPVCLSETFSSLF